MLIVKLFKSYGNLLKTHPIPTQAIQTGILMGSGDIIAQTFLEGKNIREVNWKRTVPYASIGLFVGPTVGFWYRFLEYRFGHGGLKILLKKTACDQLMFAPCFIGILVSALNAIRGYSVEEIKFNLKNNYFDILQANYKIWPFVQLVNFYFVPLHFRVLTVQCVAVVWNTYLSWKVNSMKPQLTESADDDSGSSSSLRPPITDRVKELHEKPSTVSVLDL